MRRIAENRGHWAAVDNTFNKQPLFCLELSVTVCHFTFSMLISYICIIFGHGRSVLKKMGHPESRC